MQRYKKSGKLHLMFLWSLIAFILSSYNNDVHAQSGLTKYAGARSVSLGGLSVTFNDENAIFANQAGLAFAENISFTAFGQRRYLLADGMNNFIWSRNTRQ